MTEDQLLAEVIKECDRLGLLWFHLADPRYGQGSKGFPDLVIVGKDGVIFRELKSANGDVSGDQENWGWHLISSSHDCCGPIWRIWRPIDLKSGEIRRELEEITL